MKPKSKALRSLLKSINFAIYSEKNGGLEFEEINKIEYEYNSSRRDFIIKTSKATALIGLAAAFPFAGCLNTNDSNKSKEKNPEIGIVGGGIAGLYCAYLLQKKGFLAKIYEADKRVGGRIYTKQNILGEGITTELGGEFIDSNMGDLLAICTEFNLKLMDVYEDCEKNNIVREAYFINDKHYSEEQIFNEFKKVAKRIETDKNNCGEKNDTEIAKKLDNTNLESYIRSLNCSKWLQDLLITAYTSEYGIDAVEQSSLNFISMISTQTEDDKDNKATFKIFGASDERFKVIGGSQKMTDGLASKLNGQIFSEHELKSIETSNNKVILTFSNKKVISVDYAVITVPYSVLRSIELKIEGISEEKRICINTIGYGQNNKILMGFKNHPWRTGKNKYSGYLFNPKINNGWDNAQMQNENGTGGYTMFLGGKQSYDLAKDAQKDNRKDNIPLEVLETYLAELDKAFPGAKDSFNGNHKAVFWSNNPYTKGSYSCFRVGQWTSIASQIFEPIGNVYFAGEHTSKDFQGFMNGGAESGRRVAEALLEKLKNVPKA